MTYRARLRCAVAAGSLGLLAAPSAAWAHSGIIGRRDVPIPEWLFGWAAAVVLIISFVALALLWREPRLGAVRERALFRIPAVVDFVFGLFGVLVLAAVVYAGLSGSQTPTANLAPTVIYIDFWVGLAVASLLVGNVFRLLSPWRAIARAVAWVARRVSSTNPAPLPYPPRLGLWPAVVSIVAFGWLELAYVNTSDPSSLAIAALLYTAVQMVGMALYGIEPWTRNADGFAVYFGFFARLAPWTRRDGRLVLRMPGSGLQDLRPVRGTVAFLASAIGITSFDGFSNGTVYNDAAFQVVLWLQDRGLGSDAAVQIVSTFGLLLMIGFIAGIYWLGVRGMRTVKAVRSERLGSLGLDFVHSLVPIAAAYLLAHYFSSLVTQGQATAYLISDPLGDGSDLFGTADKTVDYGIVKATGIWYFQVAVLVIGHAWALALAHDRALVRFKEPKVATRSQNWMLAVMVGFTSLGLWLLASTG